MSAEWPVVTPDDDGIRPAGEPDACFYCQAKVGDPHGQDCVCVVKKVRLRYVFEADVTTPHHWDEQHILYHRNDGSWCADNALDDLEKAGEADGCLCSSFKCEFVEVVDPRPRRAP